MSLTAFLLDWLASESQLSYSLCPLPLPSQALGLQISTSAPNFDLRAGDLNSGPHDSKSKWYYLLTHHPSPLIVFLIECILKCLHIVSFVGLLYEIIVIMGLVLILFFLGIPNLFIFAEIFSYYCLHSIHLSEFLLCWLILLTVLALYFSMT